MSATISMALPVVLWMATGGEDDGRWSQFRGPLGRGVAADDAALPVEFGPRKNLLWRCEVTEGHSSPCVWGERIFLTGHTEGELETFCIDRESGEIIWVKTVPAKFTERLHRINSIATPTPAADGERVYVYFGAFGLVCYDFEGNEQWRREIPPGQNTFGTAASPIVVGELLIFVHDSNGDSFLEAIHGETGDTVWRTEREGFGSGWSTPGLWHREGSDELLVLGVWWLTGYDLADGSERWSVPGLTDEPIVTPVVGDGLVFVSSYNMKTSPEVIGLPEFDELLEKYDADADGALDYAEAEKNDSVLSRFDADGEGDHPLKIFFRFLDEDQSGKLTPEEWTKLVDWLGAFEHKNALVAIRPSGADGRAEIAWQHSQGVPECPSPLYYQGRIYLVKNGGDRLLPGREDGRVEVRGAARLQGSLLRVARRRRREDLHGLGARSGDRVRRRRRARRPGAKRPRRAHHGHPGPRPGADLRPDRGESLRVRCAGVGELGTATGPVTDQAPVASRPRTSAAAWRRAPWSRASGSGGNAALPRESITARWRVPHVQRSTTSGTQNRSPRSEPGSVPEHPRTSQASRPACPAAPSRVKRSAPDRGSRSASSSRRSRR